LQTSHPIDGSKAWGVMFPFQKRFKCMTVELIAERKFDKIAIKWRTVNFQREELAI
jgi:hypothetical protein